MRNLCVVGLVLGLVGCERYVEVDSSPLAVEDREYILAIILDTSKSFSQRMFGDNGTGYKFFLRTSDQLFRDRMGEDHSILISQLSAEERTLLWEGTPLSLRKRFRSSDSLREFIEQHSNPSGSRAYAAVADTLEYIYELPGVSEGRTKVCVLVLSDMLDNSPTPQEDRQRLIAALSQFGQTNGCIGFYWVDQTCLRDCRQCLTDAGIGNYVIEAGVVDEPKLPSFEQ